jgi:acetyl esterase/lipase
MQEDLSVLTRANRAPDQSHRYGDHANQIGDVWFGSSGAAQRPLLMVAHGGFWRPQYDRSESVSMSVALADLGWTVVSIEYRREPGRAEQAFADIAQALDRLPQQVDGPNGDVVGNSASGHLCLWAAHNLGAARLRAVLVLAPIADLRLARSLGLGRDAVADFLGANADDQPALDPARCAPVEKHISVIHFRDILRQPSLVLPRANRKCRTFRLDRSAKRGMALRSRGNPPHDRCGGG